MGKYHACFECGSPLAGKRGTSGPRKFCDKSCAQSFRNRKRVVRPDTLPAAEKGVRFVPLTQGRFARVDEIDFEDVSRWNWSLSIVSNTEYAVRGRSAAEAADSGRVQQVLMHRYLMGDPPNKVDHRNGDGLDNRKANLRAASTSENGMNARSRGGTSRFKGVSQKGARWRASIRINYKTIYIGGFETEEEAARAYDEAARRSHGAFACVNFPREGEHSAIQK